MPRSVKDLSDVELFERVAGVPPQSEGWLREPADASVWSRWDQAQWLKQPGIGPVRAERMVACFELGRRAWNRHAHTRPKITSPEDAWWHVRHLGLARQERLMGLYLDAQNGLLRVELLSVGGLNITRTAPREVLHPAIKLPAAGFILAHNHPSGCADPSPEDWSFTRHLRKAAASLGVTLHDHLIIAAEGYSSLRELPAWED